MCLDGEKNDRVAFQARADYQNHAIGWLHRGYSSLGGGKVVRFPRIWMVYGECRLRYSAPSSEGAGSATSRMRTRSPRAMSWCTRWLPMKPEPPVTRDVFSPWSRPRLRFPTSPCVGLGCRPSHRRARPARRVGCRFGIRAVFVSQRRFENATLKLFGLELKAAMDKARNGLIAGPDRPCGGYGASVGAG